MGYWDIDSGMVRVAANAVDWDRLAVLHQQQNGNVVRPEHRRVDPVVHDRNLLPVVPHVRIQQRLVQERPIQEHQRPAVIANGQHEPILAGPRQIYAPYRVVTVVRAAPRHVPVQNVPQLHRNERPPNPGRQPGVALPHVQGAVNPNPPANLPVPHVPHARRDILPRDVDPGVAHPFPHLQNGLADNRPRNPDAVPAARPLQRPEQVVRFQHVGVPSDTVNAIVDAVLEVTPHVDPNWLRAHIHQTRILNPQEIIRQIFDEETHVREVLDDRLLDVSTVEEDIVDDGGLKRPTEEVEVEALFETLQERSTAPDFLCPYKGVSMRGKDFINLYFNTVRVDVLSVVLGSFTHDMDILLVLSIIHKDRRQGYNKIIDLFRGKDCQKVVMAMNKGALGSVRPNKNRIRPIDICPDEYKIFMQEIQQMCAKASRTVKFECGVCFEEQEEKDAIECEILEQKDDKKEYDSSFLATSHQFCRGCVSGYTEASLTETTVSSGGTGLKCMDASCGRIFKYANVIRSLDSRLKKLFDRRIQEEVLREAGITFEKCKYCSFAAEMETPAEVDKVFNCGKCKASFCRLCQHDWRVHIGRRCDEMNGANETEEERMRKNLEEQLARVAVRYCIACNIPFDKKEGCNKMTCRCGRYQCFMCRESIQGYDHFCNHVLRPGETICPTGCGKCLLWIDGGLKDKADRKKIVDNYRGRLPDVYLDSML